MFTEGDYIAVVGSAYNGLLAESEVILWEYGEPNELFADGLETGDTEVWLATQP